MLIKLLKYDLKAMLKFWWITALTSTVATIIACGCSYILNSEKYNPPWSANTLLGLTLFFAVVVMIAFPLISSILIYVRFYQNFFTDQGYLTFTLPAKRSQLLNSKLLSAFITSSVTGTLVAFEFSFLFTMPYTTYTISELLSISLPEFDAHSFLLLMILALELVILSVVSTLSSILFTFCCITFASIITKRAKLLTAIGIYYGTSTVVAGILESSYLFGGIALIEKIFTLPDHMFLPAIYIVLLCIILFLTIICLLLYTLEYFMLDRKLNLN